MNPLDLWFNKMPKGKRVRIKGQSYVKLTMKSLLGHLENDLRVGINEHVIETKITKKGHYFVIRPLCQLEIK